MEPHRPIPTLARAQSAPSLCTAKQERLKGLQIYVNMKNQLSNDKNTRIERVWSSTKPGKTLL